MSRTDRTSFGSLSLEQISERELFQKLADRPAYAATVLHSGNAGTIDAYLFGQLILRPTVFFPEQFDVDILLHES